MTVVRVADKNDDERTRICKLLARLCTGEISTHERYVVLKEFTDLCKGLALTDMLDMYKLEYTLGKEDMVDVVRIIIPEEFMPEAQSVAARTQVFVVTTDKK